MDAQTHTHVVSRPLIDKIKGPLHCNVSVRGTHIEGKSGMADHVRM